MKRLIVLMALVLAALTGGGVLAAGDIKVTSQTYENHFPKDITFRVKAESSQEIKKITINYRVGSSKSLAYNYPTFSPGRTIDGEYVLSTSGTRYIVSGSDIEYFYDIEDAGGNKLRTDPVKFTYVDTRFDWKKLETEGLTVFYYGQESIARKVLEAGRATLTKDKIEAGQVLERPVKAWVYGSKQEMDVALPFRSQTTSTDIITQGQAFSEADEVLILGSDPDVAATTAHELTHLVTDQLAGNPFASIPSWLNEGLSMFAEGELRAANRRAVDDAVRRSSLLRLRGMSGQPGRPEEVNLFYGESYSIVRYLIDTYGSAKMSELLAVFKQGTNTSDALMKVYGFDVDGLENKWRASIGAPAIEATGEQASSGQPGNVPTIVPFGAKQPQTSPAGPANPANPASPQAAPPAPGASYALFAAAAAVVIIGIVVGLVFARRR